MRERPILFNGAMVRAILAGKKSQTRRAAKDVVALHTRTGEALADTDSAGPRVHCPFGQPGDRLWVRESFTDLRGTGIEHRPNLDGPIQRYAYSADTRPGSPGDYARKEYGIKWRPSIHMPREACRLVLEITTVRVERLQAGDCDTDFESRYLPEGINRVHHGDGDYYYSAFRDVPHPKNWCHPDDAFRELWTSTGGDWDSNPWVWVIEFKVVTP